MNESTYEICALYGLRRTGKTVLMKQCISKLLEDGANIEEIAFITFRRKTEYTDTDLVNDIEDAKDLPDMLYKSDGSILPVAQSGTTLINKNNDTEYVVCE